jgi:ATP-dependent helicase Lhr and Lhr-like helicase
MPSSLFRLHPQMQHAVVHDLGWRSLRPVQDGTIDAVLDGCNAVVLAPTAGGKTEASIFPALSTVLSEGCEPVAVLYLCPIRALLNNQENRLQRYARMVGLDAFKWHGDVNTAARKRFKDAPCHLLMTTPESLEVMLVSQKTDATALFGNLRMVIIDEVHAFAADDRGAHLVSLLERLTRLSGNDIQRIGLSATVGNPAEIGAWLQGSSERPFRLVDPPKPAAQRQLAICYREDLATAADDIGRLARGRKSLVFVESRAGAERVAQALSGRGVEVFIHHSSISREDRMLAEDQFTRGQNTAIVCTSTMELGIDVGDLDQVIQVDAPSSVASFLQRLGRTGRRAGTHPNCTFFCLHAESLLQATALLRLAERGWVEDVSPESSAAHILAHQVLALTLERGGVSRHRVLSEVGLAYPFADLGDEQLHQLVDTMVERRILYEGDGLLSLGEQGERLYGRKNFFELYAVFSSPPILKVRHGRVQVGTIQSTFLQAQDQREGPTFFRLAGRCWRVERADWNRGQVWVKPAERGRVPSWLGLPAMLSHALTQEIMAVLCDSEAEARWLDAPARVELEGLRGGYEGVLAHGTAPLEDTGDVQWHTFAGGAINRLLAAALHQTGGGKWVAGNLSLKNKELGLSGALRAVKDLENVDWDEAALAAAHGMTRGRVSKFQPCLPEEMERTLLVGKLLDVSGTLRFLSQTRVNGLQVLEAGPRLRDGDVDTHFQPTVRKLTEKAAQPQRPVHYIATDAKLQELAHTLAKDAVVGLDVETTLRTHSLCTVQLANAEANWVIDYLAVSSLEPLRELFEGPTTLVVHYAHFERRILAKVGFNITEVVDTWVLSKKNRGKDALGGHSLAIVAERELDLVISKAQQTSDWAMRPLSLSQVRYAALDAELMIDLHRVFQA